MLKRIVILMTLVNELRRWLLQMIYLHTAVQPDKCCRYIRHQKQYRMFDNIFVIYINITCIKFSIVISINSQLTNLISVDVISINTIT